MSNDLTVKPDVDPFLAADAATNGRRMIKHRYGQFFCGETEVTGQAFAANYLDIEWGWRKFLNKQLVETRMGFIRDGYKPAERDELDEPEKEGAQDDPWSFQVELPLQSENGELFLFVSSSWGGRSAVTGLGAICRRSDRNGSLPIIRLNAEQRDSKSFGKQWRPRFDIVGWTSAAERLAAPTPPNMDEPPVDEDALNKEPLPF